MKNIFFMAVVLCGFHTQMLAGTVTNWITAAPNFREVGGQLYNVEKSKLFHNLYGGECNETSKDWVSVAMPSEQPADFFYWHGQTIILVNYPTQATVGEKITGYALRVGETNIGNQRWELWDYGKPHLVASISVTQTGTNLNSTTKAQ